MFFLNCSLDMNGFSYALNIQPQLKGICLTSLYMICVLLTLSSRRYDEMMAFHFDSFTNLTHYDHHNSTMVRK